MGCLQSRDGEDSGCCGMSNGTIKQSNESTADGTAEETKAGQKPSEVLRLGPELTNGLLKSYQKPADKVLMKEIRSHVDRNLQQYLQNPNMYLYICGQLATRFASGFQDKPEQRFSEGMSSVEATLRQMGLGFSCKKGAKSAPNQDDFCVIVDGSTTILGVFDGHGLFGHFCSYTIQQLLPKLLMANPNYKQNLELALQQSFTKVDEALRGIAQQDGRFSVLLSGTTATLVVHRDGNLYVAHVGDSRSIICKTDKEGKAIASALTRDHSPELEEEKKRVDAHGGEVRKQDADAPSRVFCMGANYPGLAMSRAIGDDLAKCFGVIAEPEIKCLKVEKGDLFLTICSDGVWEFMSNEMVAEMINKNGKSKADKSAAYVAEVAFTTWLERENNSTDDITCIIYYLNQFS